MKIAVLPLFGILTIDAATAGAEGVSFTLQKRETPIVQNAPLRQPLLEGDNFRFELAIDPTGRQWKFNNNTDQQTLNQRLGLVYHFDLAEWLKFSYENGAGFTRNDILLFDDTEPITNVSAVFTQKASLGVQAVDAFRTNSFVQTQRRFADGQEGFEDTTTFGGDVMLKPFLTTTMRGQVSYAEKVGFDETLIFQNIYGVSLEQKIPATPFTLRAAQSFVDEQREFLPDQDRTTWKSEATLLWEILPRATWSAGFQFQDVELASSDFSDEAQTYFTQIDLPATSLMSCSMRAACETHDFSDTAETPDPKVSLSLGVRLKVADTFDASFGVKYQFPQDSQAAAPAGNTIFSLSATGFF